MSRDDSALVGNVSGSSYIVAVYDSTAEVSSDVWRSDYKNAGPSVVLVAYGSVSSD